MPGFRAVIEKYKPKDENEVNNGVNKKRVLEHSVTLRIPYHLNSIFTSNPCLPQRCNVINLICNKIPISHNNQKYNLTSYRIPLDF